MGHVAKIVSVVILGIAVFSPNLRAQSNDRIVVLDIKVAGTASDDHQQWAEILAEVGADRVRINSADNGRPGVAESESSGQTIVTVTGVIERNGRLMLPGGTFSTQDGSKIKELVAKLRVDGAQVTLSEKMAFGLTAEQLVGLNNVLAPAIEFDTKGQRIGDVVAKLQQTLSAPLKFDAAARGKFATDEIVHEELRGLSVGTVLTASIRPLGLVLVPGRPVGQSVELNIVDSRSAQEHWPIGWPIESSPAKVAPPLFERFNFELNKAPLSDALTAIEQKTKVPMLFDHNSLARDGLEIAKIRVTFEKKRQTYFRVIDDLLGQSRPRLKLELRVDEGQRPFVWISTASQQ